MKQEIKIKLNVPDGFTAKFNEATMTVEIVPEQTRPTTWEEFCKNYIITGEEHSFSGNKIYRTSSPRGEKRVPDRLYMKDVAEAEAFLAFMKLRELRYAWIGDWKPNWKDETNKYVIHFVEGEARIAGYQCLSGPMSFPTCEMAANFLESFKDLLGQAKSLL